MLIETLDVGSACRAEPDLASGDVREWSPGAASGSARQAEPTGRKTRKRKAWAPNDDDHAIYHWVKVECKSQYFVAELFGISQPTVSRIVERYEKWQAHAEARASGQLDPAERVRAQRALTYLRNEKIITSCLRLAGDVEGFQEVSDSVSKAPDGGLAGMREIRCVSRMLDRTGMASRFYRLAHRVGLDQLELVEKEPAIAPAPLSEEEDAEQEAQAAADRAELQAARDRLEENEKERETSQGDRIQSAEHAAARAREEANKLQRELAGVLELLAETQQELAAAEGGTAGLPSSAESTGGQATRGTRATTERSSDGVTEGSELAIRHSEEEAAIELKLHNLNHANRPENGASVGGACVCDTDGPENKNRANVNHGASPGGEAGASRLFRPREDPGTETDVNHGRAVTPALSQREREPAGEAPRRAIAGRADAAGAVAVRRGESRGDEKGMGDGSNY